MLGLIEDDQGLMEDDLGLMVDDLFKASNHFGQLLYRSCTCLIVFLAVQQPYIWVCHRLRKMPSQKISKFENPLLKLPITYK